jgi:hypothetical protein
VLLDHRRDCAALHAYAAAAPRQQLIKMLWGTL